MPEKKRPLPGVQAKNDWVLSLIRTLLAQELVPVEKGPCQEREQKTTRISVIKDPFLARISAREKEAPARNASEKRLVFL